MTGFVKELAGIELVVDPNRKPTPSPRLAGWTEELTDAGLGLTAMWKAGGKTVKLDFAIVQPPDDTPPFYLARRELAVGEFLDLLATRKQEEIAAVLAELFDMVERFPIRCETHTRPLAEVGEVFEEMRQGKILGRAVLTP